MRRAYFILSAGVIALGMVHIASTPRFFSGLTSAAVWFASGGLAMISRARSTSCGGPTATGRLAA
jgi:hypothetical protein